MTGAEHRASQAAAVHADHGRGGALGDKWKDAGHHSGIPILGDIADAITGQEDRHIVNTETGEKAIATVGSNQSLGEAIEKGQVRPDDCAKK